MIENFGDKAGTNNFSKTENKKNINKGGAPKGERMSTKLKKLLSKDASLIDLDLKGLSIDDALILQLVSIGLDKTSDNKEKMTAIKEILDRTEGKAMQETKSEVTTKIEPLQFKVIK